MGGLSAQQTLFSSNNMASTSQGTSTTHTTSLLSANGGNLNLTANNGTVTVQGADKALADAGQAPDKSDPNSGVLSAWTMGSGNPTSTPLFAKFAPFDGVDLAGAAFLRHRIAYFLSNSQLQDVSSPAPGGL